MFDTFAIARALSAADLTPAQVEAITDAVRQAADHGDPVTPDQLTAGITAIRAELAALELRLIKWIVGTGLAVVAAGIAAVVGILRLLG